MLKWSQASSIAFHAMVLLARETSANLTAEGMSSTLNVSSDHLAKVMQRLSKCGLVNSLRGPSGGYTVGRDPGEITMLDIYECIEGPSKRVKCAFDVRKCAGGDCIFGTMISDIDEVVSGYLSRTNLSDVSKNQSEVDNAESRLEDSVLVQDNIQKEEVV